MELKFILVSKISQTQVLFVFNQTLSLCLVFKINQKVGVGLLKTGYRDMGEGVK